MKDNTSKERPRLPLIQSDQRFTRALGNHETSDQEAQTFEPTGSSGDEAPWLLKTEEAARLLCLSRARVYELIAQDQIPSISIGRSRRIRRDQLWRWMEDQIA